MIAGSIVTLNAGASTDSDGTIVSFSWTQVAGPSVTLSAPTSSLTTFVAPAVTAQTFVDFTVTVVDDDGARASDTVRVTVTPAGATPSTPSISGNRYVSALSLSGADVVPRGIAMGPDGVTYSVGSFGAGAPLSAGGRTVNSGDSQADIYLLVQNPDGTVRSLAAFGGGGGPDFSADIAIDDAGAQYLVGGISGSSTIAGLSAPTGSPGNTDAFVVKLGPTGAAEWLLTGKGPGFALGNEIEIASNGDLVVTGSFQNAIDFGNGVTLNATAGPGIGQAFLLRVSPTGKALWARAISGPIETGGRGVDGDPLNIDGDARDRRVLLAVQFNGGSATVESPTGNLTVTGPGGGGDCLVAAFSSEGAPLFAKSFGGPGFDNCRGVGAAIDGEIAVAGEFSGAVDFGSVRLTSFGSEDIYVMRLDETGTVTSALNVGGSGDDGGPEIEVAENGAAFFTGSFAGPASISTGGSYNSPGAPREVFIAEATVDGRSVAFGEQSAGTGDDVAFALARGPNGRFALTGTYTGSLQFGATTLPAASGGGGFVAISAPDGATTPTNPDPPPPGSIFKKDLKISQQRFRNDGSLQSVDVPVFLLGPSSPGTYPLIIWSHGGSASPQNVELTEFWASQGFIVAAPAHADSAEQRGAVSGLAGASNSFSFVNRAADVSMVLDEIAVIQQALPAGYTVDAARTAVAGHSFGALTAMEIAGADWSKNGISSNDNFSSQVIKDGTIPDARVRLGVFVSPAGTEQTYGLNNFNFVDIPFLAITGTRDNGPPPPNEFPSGFRDRYDVFSSSAGDGIGADDGVNDRRQYLITFNNATHFDYLGNNNTYDEDVRDVTTRLLRGVLNGDAAQLAPLNDPAALRAARPLVFEYFARP
ncbi:MAG: hypothetical protein HXY23_05850 [Parvularculaceae bacterium]|nr:hypothetical protein [Parvularculaceae bacterium]